MATALTPDSTGEALEDRISRLLVGAVDLHCHSGPSVMARDLNHVEAMEEAAAAGFRGMLIKDHYYSATPIVALLKQTHGHLGVELFSGVPLNNSNGGFNKHAVDAGCSLGANLVWMPTFSAKNHIDSPFGIKAGFPHTINKMIPFDPLTPIDDNGEVKDEVKEILDLVAQYDVILSGGHMHVSEIFKVFEEARKRGVTKLLVNHPTFILDASKEDIRKLATELDAYIEHSLCMYIKLTHAPEGDVPARGARRADPGGHGRSHHPRLRSRPEGQRPSGARLPQRDRGMHRPRLFGRGHQEDDLRQSAAPARAGGIATRHGRELSKSAPTEGERGTA